MKKIVSIWKKEEIPQITCVVFLFMHIVLVGAVAFAPFQNNSTGAGNWRWLFVSIITPTVIALLVGTCMTLWKLKWPSSETVVK